MIHLAANKLQYYECANHAASWRKYYYIQNCFNNFCSPATNVTTNSKRKSWGTISLQYMTAQYTIMWVLGNKVMQFYKLKMIQSRVVCTTCIVWVCFIQRSRKIKFLGEGTAQDDMVLLCTSTCHICICYIQSQVILNILDCMHVLHSEFSHKQKDLTDYKHWNYWESFGVTMHRSWLHWGMQG